MRQCPHPARSIESCQWLRDTHHEATREDLLEKPHIGKCMDSFPSWSESCPVISIQKLGIIMKKGHGRSTVIRSARPSQSADHRVLKRRSPNSCLISSRGTRNPCSPVSSKGFLIYPQNSELSVPNLVALNPTKGPCRKRRPRLKIDHQD